MWDKAVRQLVFTAIYGYLFWSSEDSSFEMDWELAAELNEIEDQSLVDLAKDQFDLFLDKQDELQTKILPHMQSWSKTFDIVKSVLYTALLELETDEFSSEEISKIIGKYIHLTQEMIGGKNPALVHAVLSKITGQIKKEELGEAESEKEFETDEDEK